MNEKDIAEIIEPIIADDAPVGKIECVIKRILDKVKADGYILDMKRPEISVTIPDMCPVLIPKRKKSLWKMLKGKKRIIGLIFTYTGGALLTAGQVTAGAIVTGIGALFGGTGLVEHAAQDINWEKIICQLLELLEKIFANSKKPKA